MRTPKQQHIVDRAIEIFGAEKVEQFESQITRKINSMPEIEMMPELTDGQVSDLLNDVIYNLADNNLFTRFIMPPFSVLDTKNGRWLDRRRILNDYLGNSLVGRAEGLVYGNQPKRMEDAANGKRDPLVGLVRADDNGTSQFDAVLAELCLKWFILASNGKSVFDPFAGGHIRGVMAALLGFNYIGIDLNSEQVAANIKRANELGLLDKIKWVNDDALNLLTHVNEQVDLVFTCPPYGDLEKYTDDPRDLSNMDYESFLKNYNEIILRSASILKDNRFMVMVVGDFRDAKGFYRGFVADTIKAAESVGLKLYNEIILLNSIGTAGMRASGIFGSNRKVVKVHQNVLVFYKGDPTKIKELAGKIDGKIPIPAPQNDGAMLF